LEQEFEFPTDHTIFFAKRGLCVVRELIGITGNLLTFGFQPLLPKLNLMMRIYRPLRV